MIAVKAGEGASTSDSEGAEFVQKLKCVTEEDDKKVIWVRPDVSGIKLKMVLDTRSFPIMATRDCSPTCH